MLLALRASGHDCMAFFHESMSGSQHLTKLECSFKFHWKVGANRSFFFDSRSPLFNGWNYFEGGLLAWASFTNQTAWQGLCHMLSECVLLQHISYVEFTMCFRMQFSGMTNVVAPVWEIQSGAQQTQMTHVSRFDDPMSQTCLATYQFNGGSDSKWLSVGCAVWRPFQNFQSSSVGALARPSVMCQIDFNRAADRLDFERIRVPASFVDCSPLFYYQAITSH